MFSCRRGIPVLCVLLWEQALHLCIFRFQMVYEPHDISSQYNAEGCHVYHTHCKRLSRNRPCFAATDLQGHLTHEKKPPLCVPTVGLCLGPYASPWGRGCFLMIETPLYGNTIKIERFIICQSGDTPHVTSLEFFSCVGLVHRAFCGYLGSKGTYRGKV